MDSDEKWAVIGGQRRALADLLAGLDAQQWQRPSLCAEWRIKDVAAHVALTPQSPGLLRILASGVRARGDLQVADETEPRITAGRGDGPRRVRTTRRECSAHRPTGAHC